MAAVKTDALVEDEVAHGFLLLVVVVAVYHCGLCLLVLFGEGSEEVGLDLLKSFGTLLLWLCRLCKLIAPAVAELVHGFAEVFVLFVVRIVPLYGLAALPVDLKLYAAVLPDFFMCKLDGLEHHVLGDLLHLAFDHHDVLLGCSHHKLEVCLFRLGECRVDPELAVNPCHAYFGDRSEERKVACCQGCGCCKSCKCVRLDVLLGGDEPDIHEYCKVEIFREKRPEGAVHEPCYKDFIVGSLSFPFHESSRKSSGRVEFFLVIYLEWKEVSSFSYFFCAGHCGKKHSATHLYDC